MRYSLATWRRNKPGRDSLKVKSRCPSVPLWLIDEHHMIRPTDQFLDSTRNKLYFVKMASVDFLRPEKVADGSIVTMISARHLSADTLTQPPLIATTLIDPTFPATLDDEFGLLHMLTENHSWNPTPITPVDNLIRHEIIPGGPISRQRASKTPTFSSISRVTRQVAVDVNPSVKSRSHKKNLHSHTVAPSQASESVTPGLQADNSNRKRTFQRKNQIVLVENNKTGRKGMTRCRSCRKVHLKVEFHWSNTNSSANLMKTLEAVTIASHVDWFVSWSGVLKSMCQWSSTEAHQARGPQVLIKMMCGDWAIWELCLYHNGIMGSSRRLSAFMDLQ
jgi:hypothetical protein